MLEYLKNKKKASKVNRHEIEDIQDFFTQNKVKVVKLNHNIDLSIQRFSQFNSYIQLSTDNKCIEITNKKLVDQPLSSLSIDPKVQREREINFHK